MKEPDKGDPMNHCASDTLSDITTGNVLPLLHEIRHALQRWLDEGVPHIIDLRALPMATDEEDQLIDMLGAGEVHCNLSITGKSTALETCFPGVWLVTHYHSDERIIGRYIEICEIPAILKSQQADARGGLDRLDELITGNT